MSWVETTEAERVRARLAELTLEELRSVIASTKEPEKLAELRREARRRPVIRNGGPIRWPNG